ncbi:MAG: hypothetical protein QM775_23000 [Pirellulales bacterium]
MSNPSSGSSKSFVRNTASKLLCFSTWPAQSADPIFFGAAS